jgi:hypothetical protein
MKITSTERMRVAPPAVAGQAPGPRRGVGVELEFLRKRGCIRRALAMVKEGRLLVVAVRVFAGPRAQHARRRLDLPRC